MTGKWVLKGYQADIDFANQFTGMVYEERGRGFLMQRGQAVEIGPDGVSRMIGSLEMNADELKALIKPGDWNTVHLIARGNTIMNIVNGHVTAFIVDDDAKGRAMKGLLGFQIHVGPPMKIEFRNIYMKKLRVRVGFRGSTCVSASGESLYPLASEPYYPKSRRSAPPLDTHRPVPADGLEVEEQQQVDRRPSPPG